jgi:Ricin-type beta-trefoil lectin domain-like
MPLRAFVIVGGLVALGVLTSSVAAAPSPSPTPEGLDRIRTAPAFPTQSPASTTSGARSLDPVPPTALNATSSIAALKPAVADTTSALRTSTAVTATQTSSLPVPPPMNSTSPPAPTNSPHDVVIRLVNVATGGSVAVGGGSMADGAAIVQSSDATSAAQRWRVVVAPNGCFHLINVASGKALDNPGGSSVSGAQMQQWSYFWGNTNQAWCFLDVGNQVFSVQNLTSGQLLDVRGGRIGDGTAIQQWAADPAAPNANQSWRLIEVA